MFLWIPTSSFHINDLVINVAGLITKLADDSKIAGVTDSEEVCQSIQRHIDKLQKWAEKRHSIL